MAIVEVKVPQLSESVAEATMLQWKKKVGEAVAADEILIEIETDKVVLEVLANLLLKYSDGLRKRWVAAASIVCVLAAFTALAQAVKDIPLSMAYAIWGGFGILATVAMGWALFGQRLAGRGWLGLLLLLGGMGLLKLA